MQDVSIINGVDQGILDWNFVQVVKNPSVMSPKIEKKILG